MSRNRYYQQDAAVRESRLASLGELSCREIFTTYCTMVKETTKFLFTYKLCHRLKRLRFMLSVLAVGVCKSGTRFQGDHAHVREEFNKRSDCTNHLFELHCA